MIIEELKTCRLVLRKLTPETYTFIYKNYSDKELQDFLSINSAEELEAEKEKYKKGLATYNRSFVNFQLRDIENGQCIGGCGFHTWAMEHSRAELGYALTDDSFKNQGFMTEALKAVIDYGFERMNLNRIEALVGPNNVPSIKLLAKFGFSKEGNLREHYRKNGTIGDSLAFSLLRSEYLERLKTTNL